MRQEKGITLIALVITIIVLLILAGVTIAMLSGNNSAPEKAQAAAADTKVAEAKEQAALDVIDKYTTYMDGKYHTNALATATSFTAWYTANPIAERSGMFEVSGTSITITPKTSEGKTVTGTVQAGGSISWSESLS